VAILGFYSLPAYAEITSFEDALVQVYETNPTLQAERAKLRETDEQVSQALSNWRPDVEATANAGISNQTINDNSSAPIPSSSSGLLIEVVRAVLIPVAFGISGVMWLQLWINAFDTDSTTVRKIENTLAYISADAKSWVTFSIKATVGFAAGLLLLIVLVPHLRVATRALSVKNWAAKIAACLVTFSSFTFFSQTPFKFDDWQDSKRVQAEKRMKDDESGKVALPALSGNRSGKSITD
jgi:hypothetical protein